MISDLSPEALKYLELEQEKGIQHRILKILKNQERVIMWKTIEENLGGEGVNSSMKCPKRLSKIEE